MKQKLIQLYSSNKIPKAFPLLILEDKLIATPELHPVWDLRFIML